MTREKCSASRWGSLAANVLDAEACVTDCRLRLLHSIGPRNHSLESLCEAASDSHRRSRIERAFRAVYCCDSQTCGVDNVVGKGRDPNVNWLISVCQSVGYRAIVDPGPPDSSHHCACASAKNRASPSATPSAAITSISSPSTLLHRTLSAEAEDYALTEPQLPQFTTRSAAAIAGRASSATSARPLARYPSFAAGLAGAEANVETASPRSGGTPTAVAVIAALTTTAGVAVIFAFALWRLRLRRRRHPGADMKSRSKSRGSASVPDSPTPLVSPSGSPASPDDILLSPPPRLQERRFLLRTPSRQLLYGGRERERCDDRDAFPAVADVEADLTSQKRPSRSVETSTRSAVAAGPVSPARTCHNAQRSESAASTTPAVVCFGPAPGAAPSTGRDGATAAPPRSPRQYHKPFPIAALASPGPPPNRALPPTPRNDQRSPPATPTSRHGDAGPTKGAELAPSPPKVDVPKETHGSSPSTNEPVSQTLHGQAGQDGVDTSAGASSIGRHGELNSPVLGEGELERLGGSYR
ncbi:hypothetical protein CDD83_3184 [Cordyceps sp. RAO-2017]|nr:hypothetical protein CDD83_3184 [Cordyceps sp. RAO-2017]